MLGKKMWTLNNLLFHHTETEFYIGENLDKCDGLI